MAAVSAVSATLRDYFDDICSCIFKQDVVSFADELLRDGLRIYNVPNEFEVRVAETVTVSQLVSDAISKVGASRDKFDKLVSILESRDIYLASNLKSDYLSRRLSAAVSLPEYEEEQPSVPADHDLPLSPERQKERDFCSEYVTSLRQTYKAPAPHWEPLPLCQHIKLSMIKRKGKRYAEIDEITAERRVLGEVGKLLSTTSVQDVDSDRIFEIGIFDEDRQVILVEGVSGMGKTSLAYYYCQKWSKGELNVFDAVAFVRLRDLHACEVDHILPNLLSTSSMKLTKEMAKVIVNSQKVLIIMDGWDEASVSFRNTSFLDSLVGSVSPQTRILITSRPELSLDLHDRANRVEILGFTTHDIRKYFKTALKSQIQTDHELKSAYDKLSSHLDDCPVIESCCYVPLNSAILAYIYLNHNQTLPVTRWELFRELVLCCIVKEISSRQPRVATKGISLFDHLPSDLKRQLNSLSLLAFEGVHHNKIIFTQEDLASHQIDSTLGLLHCVEGFGSVGSQVTTYNFIHLSVQELLAAYYISQLESAEHCEQFQLLLNKQKFQVLQFYAGLTKLSNVEVRNFITSFYFLYNSDDLKLIFMSFLNCIFEAQIKDQSFCEQIRAVYSYFEFVSTFLSPIDCLSINYFSSYIQNNITFFIFFGCSITSHSLDLLLGDSAKILESVKAIILIGNKITDHGVGRITRALPSNNRICLKDLRIGDDSVTDIGTRQLLSALTHCKCLETIYLEWSCGRPKQLLTEIGEQVNGLSQLTSIALCLVYPNDNEEQEEVIVEWFQSVCAGMSNLIRSLEYSKVVNMSLSINSQQKTISCRSELDLLVAKMDESLRVSVNQTREIGNPLQLGFCMNNFYSKHYYSSVISTSTDDQTSYSYIN